MCARLSKHVRILLTIGCGVLLAAGSSAAKPAPAPGWQNPDDVASQMARVQNLESAGTIDVFINGPNGAPLEDSALVTLVKLDGETQFQDTAKHGHVRFGGVPPREYKIQVVSPKYSTTEKQVVLTDRGAAKITIDLAPLSAEDAATAVGILALPPKTQREVSKALEDLRTDKLNDARKHLDNAAKAVPANAEIDYLYGVYSSKTKDPFKARAYWMKALEANPKHLNALIAVGNDLLQEKKAAEATPYLKRAVDAEPSAWRAQALLAEAYLLQGMRDDAIKHAERAIELGHERAESVQLVLVRAYAERGDKDHALSLMQTYVQAHPTDAVAAKDLETLKNVKAGTAVLGDSGAAASEMAAVTSAATELPAASNWLPPDVDENVPPVEPGASCAVDDVVRKAGIQLMTLVADVDRFAATESLVHESISKSGLPSAPEKRKFEYVVSIQEVQHGYLNVEEYRSGSRGSQADFPDGVATNGLPALVLIFHPYNAPDFEMTCEGLARWNGGLAWQVHFKQRPDKPNVIKRYRIGADGPSYPVALKGRAWISADNYQIVRLETDLVSPVPQIRLVADHSDIEYGPVKFKQGNISMWLPQSADVYYDWKGRRIHRRHSFGNYLLFGVEDKQKISAPKVVEAPAGAASSEAPQEKP